MDPADRVEREAFGKMMASLAMALPKDLDPLTIGVYRKALMDVPLSRLGAACNVMLVELRMFPTPSEWREYVDLTVEAEELLSRQELPAKTEEAREAYYDCNVCLDAGWESIICDPASDDFRYPTEAERNDVTLPVWSRDCRRRWCGRKACKGPEPRAHSYSNRCPCYGTNPTIKRKLVEKQRYAKPARRRREQGELRGV